MRLERRANIPGWGVVLAPIAAVLAALAMAALLVAACGASPWLVFRNLMVGAVGSRLAVAETLTRATPLILTGLAAATAFRARLWNIGAEGQFFAGAIAAVAVGAGTVPLPPHLVIPVVLLAGALAGMAVLLLPLALRLYCGVDEVVTTLLLNFIVVLFVSMLVDGPMKDPMAFGWPQSIPLEPAAMLPKLLPHSPLHIGFALALALAFVIWAVQKYSVFGFESRAAGYNKAAASYAGINIKAVLAKIACLSGGLAGVAGAVQVMGVQGYVTTGLSPGFGYTGIVVAMLAGLHPLGVVLAGLFIAAMYIGADSMSRTMAVPSAIADVAVALSLLTMLISMFLVNYRVRR